MMRSRLTKYLSKVMAVNHNGPPKRIYFMPSLSFTSTSNTEKTPPLESIVDHVPQKDLQLSLQPYYHCTMIPYDTIRKKLVRSFNYWMNLPNDTVEIIDQIHSMAYNALALADDVNDNTHYRRGYPTSHKIFGIPRAEIASAQCLFIIMKKLLSMNMEVADLYIDAILTYNTAIYKELNFHENMVCPSLEEYRQLSIERGSSILCLPFKLMHTLSGYQTDLTKIWPLFGLYFQYLTDISNLDKPVYWKGKGFCTDITEGKSTLAFIHAINSGTVEADIISNILRQKTEDVATKKYCLILMERLGSLDFARKATVAVENELREEVHRLGGNPLLLECIDQMNVWNSDESLPKFFQNDKSYN